MSNSDASEFVCTYLLSEHPKNKELPIDSFQEVSKLLAHEALVRGYKIISNDYKKFQSIFCQSNFVKDDLNVHYKLPDSKLKIVRVGVRTSFQIKNDELINSEKNKTFRV
jgi:hypothetical protein